MLASIWLKIHRIYPDSYPGMKGQYSGHCVLTSRSLVAVRTKPFNSQRLESLQPKIACVQQLGELLAWEIADYQYRPNA